MANPDDTYGEMETYTTSFFLRLSTSDKPMALKVREAWKRGTEKELAALILMRTVSSGVNTNTR